MTLDERQNAMQARAMAGVERLAFLVHHELATQIEKLRIASSSPLFDGDLDRSQVEALLARMQRGQPLWTALSLSDRDGNRLVDAPFQLTGELGRVVEAASHARAVATAKPAIGRIKRGPRGQLAFAIRMPVIRDGRVHYILSAVVRYRPIGEVVRAIDLPPGWLGVIVDDQGQVVARTQGPDDLIGQRASESLLQARTRGGSGIYEGVTLDGVTTVSAYQALPDWNWSVHIGIPKSLYEAPLRRATWMIGTGAVTALSLAGLFLWLLAREAAARRRDSARKADADRFDAAARVAAMVAHDFNNLLTAFRTGAHGLKQEPANVPKVTAVADAMLAAAQRGATLTRQLAAIAGGTSLMPVAFRLQDRVPELRALLETCVHDEIGMRVDVPDDLWPIFADPGALDVALTNLALNARDAMPGGGTLAITARNDYARPGAEAVVIRVADTGVGMTPEIAARAFAPFFTTKPSGKGVGLGLSQVQSFAANSAGEVTVESEPGRGTTFVLRLPRAHALASAPDVGNVSAAALPVQERGVSRLLLVEDAPDVAAGIRELLTFVGYDVVTIPKAADALAHIESGPPFDMVLSDIALGDGMSGLEFARLARERQPALPIVLMTGYGAALDKGRSLGMPVLLKPFGHKELFAALQAARAPSAT